MLVGAAFLAGVDLFIVNVAFDEIAQDFGSTDLQQLSWILNAYAVVFAALLVPMGRLADRYGQKAWLVGGLTTFVLASVACGLAPSVWWLVAFRSLQAVGAAAMTPASLGLLLASVDPHRRAAAARGWALTGAVAAAVGPALGGGLVQISWQWAFWINLPAGVLLVAGTIRYVPDVRHGRGTPVPDLLGAVLLATGIGALVLGLVQGPDWSWGSGRTIAAFAASVLTLALFTRRNVRHPSPVIAPDLVSVSAFRWANAAMLVFNGGFAASLLASILWMQQVWGYDALRTGLAVAIGPLFVPLASTLVHRLAPRARPGRMIALGSMLFGAAALWQAAVLGPVPAFATAFLPAWVLGGIGVGLAVPNLLAAGTSSLPPAQAATGGGVVSMARQVGFVLGIAVLVTVLSSSGSPSGFADAWRLVAAAMVLAAAAALRMDHMTARPAVTPATATA